MIGLNVGIWRLRRDFPQLPAGIPIILHPGTLSGAVVGQETTVSGENITGDGVTLTYQWVANDAVIVGATSATYTPQASDDLKTLRRWIYAENVSGATARPSQGIVVTFPAPVEVGISNQSFSQNTGTQSVDVSGAFTGGGMTFSLPGNPGFASVSGTNILVNTGAWFAATPVTVRATNSGGFAETEFDLTITIAVPQAAGSVGDREYSFSATSSTLDLAGYFAGEGLTYSLTDGDELASLNGSVLTIDRSAVVSGNVTVRATNASGFAEQSFLVTINPAAPVFIGPLAAQVYTKGSGTKTYNVTSLFTGGSLTYSLIGAPSAITIDSGVISTDTAAYFSPVSVTVKAENASGSVQGTVQIRVNHVAPFLATPIADQTLTQGGIQTFSVAANFSGEALAFSIVEDLSGVASISSLGVVSVNAANLASGNVTVRATNSGGSVVGTFLLTVGAAAPVFTTPIPDQSFYKGTSQTRDVSQDVSGIDLTYAITSGGEYASIGSNSGLLTWDTSAAIGPVSITIQVNNNGGSASDTHTLTVLIAIPVLILSFQDVSYSQDTGTKVISLLNHFTGEALTYTLTDNANGAASIVGTDLHISTDLAFSDRIITVRAENSSGLVSDSFTVSVTAVSTGDPRPPADLDIAAHPATSSGEVYVCWNGPDFWGDGTAGGDALGVAGSIYADVGGYRYSLIAGDGIGTAEIGTTFVVGPGTTTAIADVRDLYTEATPLDAVALDGGVCLLLQLPEELWGTTASLTVTYANDYGLEGTPIVLSVDVPTGDEFEGLSGALLLKRGDANVVLTKRGDPDTILIKRGS